MLAPVFQTFMDRLQRAADREALGGALSTIVGAFGLSGFSYIDSFEPDQEAARYITTYPEAWVRRYVSRRYYHIDPVIIRAQQSASPFVWDSRSPDTAASDEQRAMLSDALDFGIECGITFPIRDGGTNVAAVSFASDQTHEAFRRTVDIHHDVLQLASIYFHVHARRRFRQRHHAGISLTSAETSCLQWVARGKRTADIGEILGFSRRVVLWHLKSARLKLNATTLSQAVAAALHNRLIEP